MEKDNLYWLKEGCSNENISLDELKEIVDEYPYFQTARLFYTKKLCIKGNEQYGEELSKTAILCADRRKLFYLIQHDNYEMLLNVPDKYLSEEKDRTEALLDSYLESFGSEKIKDTTTEISGMNIAYSDYFSYLESLGVDNNTDTSNHPFQHQDIIDTFIENNESNPIQIRPFKENKKNNRDETERIDEGSEFLTETLAKIYIKQKKYEQALTIIKRLSLNFPKKSAYFADQIRFLEYLIINDKKNS